MMGENSTQPARLRDRRFTLTSLALAALLAFATVCHSAPPRKLARSDPAAQQVPEDLGPNGVAVNLSKATDSGGFRKDVTQDQRIHVHLDLGRDLESQGMHEAALTEYQQALAACERKGIGRSRSADEALAHRRIAGALDRLGRFAQAEMHYKKAIKLSPKDPRIWNDAGYSYYLQSRWSDAERTLKTAARLAPEDARIKTNLGLTLAAAGRPREALPLLSQYSGDAVGHAKLGYLLAATGQLELAREQYLQALARRPHLAIAQQALARLDRIQQSESVAAANSREGRAPASMPAADAAVVRAASSRTPVPPPRQFNFGPAPIPPLPAS
jgi:tetratricopeptide (TPR) repeat protein